jgi:sarcosine oxidase subunit gamma
MQLMPRAGRLILQGDAAARAAAEQVWGVSCSLPACRARTANGRSSLWLGPDEYLLLQASSEALPIESLEQALQPHAHSLVEVSHRQVSLQVRGPNAQTILASCCPLDLDQSAFPLDMCTRTVLAKAEIVLWRRAADCFHLEVWRSFLSYAQELLTDASLELSPAP